ncbi:hypothetical protein PSPO01_06582 [Paraphaeosphaeria sporulosa]
MGPKQVSSPQHFTEVHEKLPARIIDLPKRSPQQPAENDPDDLDESVQLPVLNIDTKTNKVIQALFHIPGDNEVPNEIEWTALLRAFTKLCFAAEKLPGSAWQFTPRRYKLKRRIQFHEPHPSGSFDPFH